MTLTLPRELITAVKEGRAVLFLGAGASRGASDPEKSPIPDGKGLAALLADAFLGSDYEGLDLRTAYDLACSQRDVRIVQRKIYEILNPYQPAAFHLLLPTFAWAGLLTTNYDLLIERAYQRVANGLQKLVPNVKDGDRATDLLGNRNLLYIKLHGCITQHQEVKPPLIASTEQLISFREGRTGQFDTFLEWAKTKTLIFCGYSFLDPNLRALFYEIIKEGDYRPRHFIINKGLREAEITYWRERRAEAIDTTFQIFLEQLDYQIAKTDRALSAISVSNNTTFSRFITARGMRESEDLRIYLSSFIEHITAEINPKSGAPRRFYSGFSLGWYSITAELDVRQPIVDDIINEHILTISNNGHQSVVVIKGHAGSGKSVVLRRICYEAAKLHGKLCFYVSREHIIQTERFEEIFTLTNLPVLLFVDNISEHRHQLVELLRLAAARRVELKVIGAETYHTWNATCEELEPFVSQAPEMRYLSENSIKSLIEKLEKHGALGYLQRLSPEERIKELKHVHGRQLLVALLEATNGTPLIEIIANEYKSIAPDEARLLYLDICSLHRFGPPVRAGLISRIHNISFEDFREKFFKPLEAIVVLRLDSRSGDYVYEARHSFIAHTVYETAINSTEERFDNIVRVMNKLNPNFSYDWEVIGQLVRADNLERNLGDHAKIRQIYDVADTALGEQALLLHQRGIFEMHVANNAGGLAAAERLFHRAQELAPSKRSIKHSLAEVDLRRSRTTDAPEERRIWRQRATEKASALLKGNTPYPHHTILKAAIDAVRDALTPAETDPSDAAARILGDSIAHAEQVLKRGLQAFPNEAILLSEEGELSSILSKAVEAERSFQKAFEANPRSTLIAKRLARIKRSKAAYDDAKAVLQKCLEFNPGAQDVHYDLAMSIIESAPTADQTDGETIAYHLRRSFSPGDKNHQAHFWYTRQLCLLNRYEEAKPIYKKIQDARIAYKEKKAVLGIVKVENGTAREFTGVVTHKQSGYGFIRCEPLQLDAFFSSSDLHPELADTLSVSDTVMFELGFNLLGPIALNVHM